MKKRLVMIATLMISSLVFSCEEDLDQFSEEKIIEVRSETDDEEFEDELPPVRKSKAGN